MCRTHPISQPLTKTCGLLLFAVRYVTSRYSDAVENLHTGVSHCHDVVYSIKKKTKNNDFVRDTKTKTKNAQKRNLN